MKFIVFRVLWFQLCLSELTNKWETHVFDSVIVCIQLVDKMELSDRDFVENADWDPCYLRRIFDGDFFENSDLWQGNMEFSDQELLKYVEKVEPYKPIVEDISLEDEIWCSEVEKIEEQ